MTVLDILAILTVLSTLDVLGYLTDLSFRTDLTIQFCHTAQTVLARLSDLIILSYFATPTKLTILANLGIEIQKFLCLHLVRFNYLLFFPRICFILLLQLSLLLPFEKINIFGEC